MEGTRGRFYKIMVVITVCAAVLPSTGCIVGLPAQIGWMIWGLKKPAEYDGLKNQNVAVVCHSTETGYGSDQALRELTKQINYHLDMNVKKVEMISSSKVSNYVTKSSLSEKEILEIGRGVKADKIIAVKMQSYSLHDGASFYRGKAAYTVTVYDMTDDGRQVWTSGRDDYEFPKSAGLPKLDATEKAFETMFVEKLSLRIAQSFYDTDMIDDYADEDIIVE